MVRDFSAIRPAVLRHEGDAARRSDDAQATGIEALGQFRTQQNLVEQMPVMIHVLTCVVIVRSSGFTFRVPKVAPHRIVEESVLAALDRSSSTRRNPSRHQRTNAPGHYKIG